MNIQSKPRRAPGSVASQRCRGRGGLRALRCRPVLTPWADKCCPFRAKIHRRVTSGLARVRHRRVTSGLARARQPISGRESSETPCAARAGFTATAVGFRPEVGSRFFRETGGLAPNGSQPLHRERGCATASHSAAAGRPVKFTLRPSAPLPLPSPAHFPRPDTRAVPRPDNPWPPPGRFR